MSAVVTLESTASLGEILGVMERDGAVIVANLLSNDLVQRLRADLLRTHDQAAVAVERRADQRIARTQVLRSAVLPDGKFDAERQRAHEHGQ